MLACEPLLAIRVVALLNASDPSLPVGPGGPLSTLRAARTRPSEAHSLRSRSAAPHSPLRVAGAAQTIATGRGQDAKGEDRSAEDFPIIQIAADEWLVLGTDDTELIAVDDEHAIIESDNGWVSADLDANALGDLVRHHIEWQLPSTRPALAQGQIAGVPAKLYLPADSDGAVLICLAALAHELEERVG